MSLPVIFRDLATEDVRAIYSWYERSRRASVRGSSPLLTSPARSSRSTRSRAPSPIGISVGFSCTVSRTPSSTAPAPMPSSSSPACTGARARGTSASASGREPDPGEQRPSMRRPVEVELRVPWVGLPWSSRAPRFHSHSDGLLLASPVHEGGRPVRTPQSRCPFSFASRGPRPIGVRCAVARTGRRLFPETAEAVSALSFSAFQDSRGPFVSRIVPLEVHVTPRPRAPPFPSWGRSRLPCAGGGATAPPACAPPARRLVDARSFLPVAFPHHGELP